MLKKEKKKKLSQKEMKSSSRLLHNTVQFLNYSGVDMT